MAGRKVARKNELIAVAGINAEPVGGSNDHFLAKGITAALIARIARACHHAKTLVRHEGLAPLIRAGAMGAQPAIGLQPEAMKGATPLKPAPNGKNR
jgi:hypothetical protein